MKLKKQRKYRDSLAVTRGIISKNPVLYYGFALPFIIVSGTTLKNGVALSLAMMFVIIPAEVVAAFFGKQIPKFARIPVYTITSMAFFQLGATFIKYISPNIFDSLGIYFPLIVINSILISRTEYVANHLSPGQAMFDGFVQSVGFALVMCTVSSIREVLGYGTIWGRTVSLPIHIPGVLLPFAGFIIIGFLSAFGRYIDRMIKKFLYISENRANV